MFKKLIFLSFCAWCLNAKAQDSISVKKEQSLSLHAGGVLNFGNINLQLEQELKRGENKSHHLALNVGCWLNQDLYQKPAKTGLIYGLRYLHIAPQKRNRFAEFDLGIALLHNRSVTDALKQQFNPKILPDLTYRYNFIPVVHLGLIYVYPSKPYTFRIGVGIPDLFRIGVSWKF